MLSIDSEQDEIYVPEHILNEAATATADLLPDKSKKIYEKEFRMFSEWREANSIKGVNEEVLLAYFSNKSKKVKPSSLWSYYSMLKSTILINENVDISKYCKLHSLLKKQTVGYTPKKSQIFEKHHIKKFLNEAPDEKYLFMKVLAIMGIAGGCRIDELYKMEYNHIDDRGSVIVVDLPDTKTNKKRTFTVIGEESGVSPISTIRKYLSLRPSNVKTNKFFLTYRAPKCTVQPVGINTMAKVPRMIAQFLSLPDENSYTGHCFRRSSASLLANSGADLLTIKRHGGWKSSSVAEGYIEESVSTKVAVSKKIFGEIQSNDAGSSTLNFVNNEAGLKTEQMPQLHINKIENSTVNVYINKTT